MNHPERRPFFPRRLPRRVDLFFSIFAPAEGLKGGNAAELAGLRPTPRKVASATRLLCA